MARAGVAVHETVNVTGHDAAAVSSRVSAALMATGAYEVVELEQGRHQLVRTYRPTWALAAGVAGLAFFGLGALFLLVRRTESCTISVTYGSTGSVLALAGCLLPDHLDTARRAAVDVHADAPLSPPEAEVPPAPRITGSAPSIIQVPVSADPRLAESAVLDATIARHAHRTGAGAPTTLHLTDGRCLPLEGTVVIGRDPSCAPGLRLATLVAVADPDRAISKSHLVITADADTLLVEDLHSTNGTEVTWPDGTRCTLSPGQPLRLAAGAVVHFGGHAAEVVGSG